MRPAGIGEELRSLGLAMLKTPQRPSVTRLRRDIQPMFPGGRLAYDSAKRKVENGENWLN